MKNEPTNADTARYKILRDTHVVFVLRKNGTETEFIALPGNTADADIPRIAQAAPSEDWRKIEIIDFDSIQSNVMPDTESQR